MRKRESESNGRRGIRGGGRGVTLCPVSRPVAAAARLVSRDEEAPSNPDRRME